MSIDTIPLVSRTALLDEVVSWEGVPFLHQGRTRQGCDCVGFVIGVAAALHLPNVDKATELLTHRRYPNPQQLREALAGCMGAPVKRGCAQPGDILVMRWKLLPLHIGILLPPCATSHGLRTLMHAAVAFNGVKRVPIDADIENRIIGDAWAMPGVGVV